MSGIWHCGSELSTYASSTVILAEEDGLEINWPGELHVFNRDQRNQGFGTARIP